MATIAPELEAFAVPIDSIRPHAGNPRRGDVDAIMQSLEAHGQRQLILVRAETGEIVAGAHRHEAMRRLGWKTVAALLMDLTEDQAARYMAADNRTSDLGGYDDVALLGLLQGLAEGEAGLDGTGYDNSDLDDLAAKLAGEEEYVGDGASVLDRYRVSGTRAMVMTYRLPRFRWVVAKLAALGTELGATSNAQTVLRLVEDEAGASADG